MEKDIHQKYLLSNNDDHKWRLVVNSVGFQSVKPGGVYPPSNHPPRYLFSAETGRVLDEYQLIYIAKGKGFFYSESLGKNKAFPVSEGTFFMLFPGEWHSYHPDSASGWDEYWIGFKGDLISRLMTDNFFSKRDPVLPVGLHDDIFMLYRKAIQTAVEQKSGYQQLLYGILNHLLGAAFFYLRNTSFGSSSIMDAVARAREIIGEKYAELSPKDVAGELNMGYSKFRKIFKAYTGFAPAQYITEVRISKAKELLTNTMMPIKAIAATVGFEYFEYFFTVFRSKEGRTPTEYRRMTQGRIIKQE